MNSVFIGLIMAEKHPGNQPHKQKRRSPERESGVLFDRDT